MTSDAPHISSADDIAVNGTPPSDLLFLLWCLLAREEEAPAWMLPGGTTDEDGDEPTLPGAAAADAARRFMSLSMAAQLEPPTRLVVSARHVLSSALRMHAAAAAVVRAPMSERAVHAARVIEGERRIWEKAQALLHVELSRPRAPPRQQPAVTGNAKRQKR